MHAPNTLIADNVPWHRQVRWLVRDVAETMRGRRIVTTKEQSREK